MFLLRINWRPLCAIAQVLSGDWPARVLQSFNLLTASRGDDPKSLGVMLLEDLRAAFAEFNEPGLYSRQLVDVLCGLPDRPWAEANKGGNPINEHWLARRLRDFGIQSRCIRNGHLVGKGYYRTDFDEVFKRFLA